MCAVLPLKAHIPKHSRLLLCHPQTLFALETRRVLSLYTNLVFQLLGLLQKALLLLRLPPVLLLC